MISSYGTGILLSVVSEKEKISILDAMLEETLLMKILMSTVFVE